jgi:hypothetical protein
LLRPTIDDLRLPISIDWQLAIGIVIGFGFRLQHCQVELKCKD